MNAMSLSFVGVPKSLKLKRVLNGASIASPICHVLDGGHPIRFPFGWVHGTGPSLRGVTPELVELLGVEVRARVALLLKLGRLYTDWRKELPRPEVREGQADRPSTAHESQSPGCKYLTSSRARRAGCGSCIMPPLPVRRIQPHRTPSP